VDIGGDIKSKRSPTGAADYGFYC